MAVIGSLLVNVKANAAGFTSGLSKMRSELVSFSRDFTSGFAGGAFQGFAQSIGKAFSALGAGLSQIPYAGKVLGPLANGFAQVWEAIAPMLQGQAEAVDNIGKLSDRLGVSTENFVGMSHSADLAGVSQEQLIGGMEKFLKTVGDATSGSSEAIDKFAMLGISMADLKGKSPIEAMGMTFDAINDLGDVAQRASATMGIFGKSGQVLAPMIAEGSAGLRSAAKEAEALGLSFSRIDAAKVEAANDAMTRIGSLISGFFRSAVIELAPIIESLITSTVELVKEWGGLGQVGRGLVSVFKYVGIAIAGAIDAALFPVRALILQLELVGDMIEALKTGDFSGISERITKLTDPKQLAKEFAPLATGLNDWFANVEAKANAAGAEVARKGFERRGIFAEPDTAGKKKDSEKLGAAIKGSVEAFRAIAAAERRQADVENQNRPVIEAVGKVEKAVQVVADRLAKVIGLQEDIAVVEL